MYLLLVFIYSWGAKLIPLIKLGENYLNLVSQDLSLFV